MFSFFFSSVWQINFRLRLVKILLNMIYFYSVDLILKNKSKGRAAGAAILWIAAAAILRALWKPYGSPVAVVRHGWRNRGGGTGRDLPLRASLIPYILHIYYIYITAILLKYKLKMNVKTTLYLICVGFKRCFIKLSFHFEGVLLAVRGCTCMLRGCSRTLKTPNSPPL